MVKKKESISSNFENLKAEMIKKKEVAEKVFKEQNVDKNVYINENKNIDENKNKFVLKRAEKVELPKRITYYLKPSTIKNIDKLSKKASMGKSQFVQKILEEVLKNLEIQ